MLDDLDININPGEYDLEDAGIRKGDALIFPQPVWPSRILYNVDSGIQKVELSFLVFDDVRRITVTMEQIGNTNKIIALANSGLMVNALNAKALMKYLASVLTYSKDIIQHGKAKGSLGWAGTEFVPYSDKVFFDGEEQFRQVFNSIRSQNTADVWAAQVKQYRKQLPVRLCLAASFASPLVEIIGANPFIFHLWGGTGVGKTVVLMIAASVWGDPAMGKMVRTLNMTQNSMLSTAGFLNNLPFVGDELQTIKSTWQNYDRLIMCLTEGVDRGRMSYDKINETKSWRCAFITSGEEPCVKRNSGGGTKNRVIEVEATEKLIPDGNGTANFVRTHFGAAGREFIASLDRKEIRKMYKEIREQFPEDLEGKVTDKQISTAVLMLVADELARRLFWPGEPVLMWSDVLPFLSQEEDVDTSERAYSYITELVAQNPGKFDAQFAASLWGVIEHGDCYFIKNALIEQLEAAGFDFAAVKQKWIRNGYLIRAQAERGIRYKKNIRGVYTTCVRLMLPEPDDPKIPTN